MIDITKIFDYIRDILKRITMGNNKSQAELHEEFSSVIDKQNFITPNTIRYVDIGNGVAKLSRGAGFGNDTIYNVTVVRNGEKTGESKMINGGQFQAEEYINSLMEGET